MAMYEYITNEGYRLLQRMLMGEVTLDFTRVEMGDGNSPETDLKKVTALSNAVVSLEVDSVVKQENNTISISALFTNEKLEKGFYFREKGVFAKGLDGSGTEQEILFAYANAADTANYIDPPTVELVEKKIISHCTQCQKTDGVIDIVIKSGIYADIEYVNQIKDTLETHLLDKENPHNVDAKQLGLDKVNNTSDADKPVSTLQQQAIDNSKTADSVTGENPTASNSTDGNLIYLKNEGYTEQNSFSGKNKFGFGISAIDKTSEYRAGATQRLIMSSVDGNPNTVKCKYNGGNYSFGYIVIEGIDGTQSYKVSYTVSENTQGYTPRLYKDTSRSDENMLMLLVDGGNNETIVANTEYFVLSDIQVEEGTETTDYEPFCGGTASPNPDYPQRIASNGDKGYFDGVLRQGAMGSTGTYNSSNANCVTNTNAIPCESNDVINILYGSTDARVNVRWFDADGNVLSVGETTVMTTNGVEFTAPTNAKNFYFNILNGATTDTTITPSTAKHICVTINGMYAVRVKTENKNLLVNTATTTTINGVAFTVNDDGSVTCSGTATAYTAFYLGEHIQNLEVGKSYKSVGVTNCKNVVSGSNKFENMFTVTEGYTSVKPYIEVSNGVSVNKTYYPMIVSADETDDTYEPHQETTALIPVSEPLYDGDYIEVYADGTGREYHKMGSVVLNGTETWAGSATNDSTKFRPACNVIKYDVKTVSANATPNLKCNAYFTRSSNGTYMCRDGISVTTTGEITIYDQNYTTGDMTSWKERLASNPLYVVYERKEPLVEPLTAEQVAEFMKLQTFKGVTHITADGEVTVRYYCNTDSGETLEMIRETVEIINKQVEVLQKSVPETYQAKKIGTITTMLEDWKAGNTPGSSSLYSVCHGNCKYVAVGASGVTYHSEDGITWTAGSGASGNLRGVTYGNNKFVAVGESGAVYYSEDGVTWTAGSGASGDLMSVAYGDGKFVATGSSGATYYSEDGITWTAGSGASSDVSLISVAYGAGKFVAVASSSDTTYYSEDGGITWTAGSGSTGRLREVAYGAGKFVAVGDDFCYHYSEDGKTWNEGSGPKGTTTLQCLSYGNGKFVTASMSKAFYSDDGITWYASSEINDDVIAKTIQSIIYNNGKYVAVTTGGETYYLEFTKQIKTIEEAINELYSLLKA